jgi:hypothetical protein
MIDSQFEEEELDPPLRQVREDPEVDEAELGGLSRHPDVHELP